MEKHRKVQVWIFSTPLQLNTESTTSEPSCLLLHTNEARGRFWQPVTGTVEPEESFDAAALREAKEETGLNFSMMPQETNYEFEFDSRFGPAHEKVFFLKTPLPSAPLLDPHEHDAYQWVPVSEAPQHLRFPANIEGLKRSLVAAFQKTGLLVFLFCTSILFSAMTPTAHAAQDAKVIVYESPIRSKPEKSGTILEVKKAGDVLRVSSETKDGWFKTRTTSGQVGWIYQAEISPGLYETAFNSGSIDPTNRQPHVRRSEDHPFAALKFAAGPSLLFPSDMNRALSRSPYKSYSGLGFMGQLGFFLSPSTRLVLRLERFNASDKVVAYQLDFTGTPLYFGAEFDIARRGRWRSFWSLMGGIGISDSVVITNTDVTSGINTATVSGNPLAAAASVGAQYALFSWLHVTAEAGFRLAQSLQASEVSNAFQGDTPYFREGITPAQIKISEHGLFLFLGGELTF